MCGVYLLRSNCAANGCRRASGGSGDRGASVAWPKCGSNSNSEATADANWNTNSQGNGHNKHSDHYANNESHKVCARKKLQETEKGKSDMKQVREISDIWIRYQSWYFIAYV